MKNNPLLLMCLISALASIAIIVILKFLGYDELPYYICGGVAGGIAGIIIPSLLKRKKE